MVEYEEPSIVNAPGFVGKSTFRDGRAVDPEVRSDVRYITEEYGPMVIAPGETLDILDLKEKGELIYVKILTDNPYASVYLEIDDYKNSVNGETHAELLYDQRTTNAEGQFYIASDGTNGKGFPMVWNPQTNPTSYHKRIKIRVSNPLRRNNNVYGSDLSYKSKGDQPTPIQPLHMGGGSFTHPGLGAVDLATLSKAIANPVGANSAYSLDAVVNEAVFDSDGKKLGEGNPYAGLAGKPVFRRDKSNLKTSTTTRGAQFVNGTQVLAAEADGAADVTKFTASVSAATNYPGTASSPQSGTSSCAIVLTDSSGGSAHTTAAAAKEFVAGDKVFLRNGGTVHFLGVITDDGANHDGATIIFKTFPGVKTEITAFSGIPGSETHCYGTVEAQAKVSPDMVVKKVIVKRKRLVSYEG